MDPKKILRFVFKWKWTLLLGPLLVTTIVTYRLIQEPAVYEAQSKILIERNRTPIQVGPEQPLASLGMVEVMNTEIEIARSRPVIDDAIDVLGFSRGDGSAGDLLGMLQSVPLVDRAIAHLLDLGLIKPKPPREDSYEQLVDDLVIRPVPDSNVFQISLRGSNPKEVAETVNVVTDMYLRHRLEVYQAQGRGEVYESQVSDAWTRLTAARAKLEAYKRANGLASVEELRRGLVARIETLEGTLTHHSQELAILRRTYQDRYPLVVEARERIGTVQAQLVALERQLQRIDGQAAAVRDLEMEIEGHVNTYQLAKARFEEQRAREHASVAATNVLLVERAQVPTAYATTPLHLILLAALAGLGLAIAMAMVREYFDNRVDGPELAEEIFGVPVVGSVGRFRISPRSLRPGRR